MDKRVYSSLILTGYLSRVHGTVLGWATTLALKSPPVAQAILTLSRQFTSLPSPSTESERDLHNAVMTAVGNRVSTLSNGFGAPMPDEATRLRLLLLKRACEQPPSLSERWMEVWQAQSSLISRLDGDIATAGLGYLLNGNCRQWIAGLEALLADPLSSTREGIVKITAKLDELRLAG